MKHKLGFAHIGLLVALAVVVVGFAAVLTQVRRAQQPLDSQDSAPPGSAAQDIKGTADWKTYDNEDFAFQFSYPESLTLKIAKELPGNPTRNVTLLYEDLDIYDPLKNLHTGFHVNTEGFRSDLFSLSQQDAAKCKIYKKYSREYGGKSAVVVEYQGCPGNEAVAQDPHRFVVLIELSRGDLIVTQFNDLKEDILKTLVFSTETSESGLKTYRNEQYGFEMKYPGGLEVTEYPNAEYPKAQRSVSFAKCTGQSVEGGSWHCEYHIAVVINEQPYDPSKNQELYASQGGRGGKIKKVTVNNRDFYVGPAGEYASAYWLVYTAFGNRTLSMLFSGKEYWFTGVGSKLEISDEELRRIMQVLSSFKALE